MGAAADARPPRREARSRSPAITTASDARKPMTRKAKPYPPDGLVRCHLATPGIEPPGQTTASRTHAGHRPPTGGLSGKEPHTMNATSVTEHHARTGGAQDTVRQHPPGQEAFSTDIGGLPGSVPTPTAQLAGGAVYDLHVAPVTKQIGDATVRMLAYNGSIPGPT